MEYTTETAYPVILTNLQKAAEKQQRYETADLLGRLAAEVDTGVLSTGNFEELKSLTEKQLAEIYPALQKTAEAADDHGAMRALRWGQKVTAIQKSIVDRYLSKGEKLLEGNGLFVCEACGFIFIGPEAPLCPVCKAPASRFSKV